LGLKGLVVVVVGGGGGGGCLTRFNSSFRNCTKKLEFSASGKG
jgi:hypothetical protein